MNTAHTLTDSELTEQLSVATKQRNEGRSRGTSDWGLWQQEVDRLEIELKRRVAKKEKPIRSVRLERLVLWRLIKAALAAGYCISLNDGEEWVIKHSTDRRAVLAACMSTDEDVMRFREAGDKTHVVGSVWMVYGNSGWDCIADYHTNAAMDALIEPVMDWAEKLDERTR